MTAFRTLDQADVKDKRVLIRVDLNVPMEGGRITDNTRIRAAVPTIAAVTEKGGKAILLSHFGRPKGRDESELEYGMAWVRYHDRYDHVSAGA